MRNPKDIIDEYLVLKCQNGDKKAFIKLVKRWHPRIIRQATWHTGNPDIAPDIAQECWNDILNGLHKLKNSKAFKVWIHRIIHRRSVDWIRQKQKDRENIQNVAQQADALSTHDDHQEKLLLLQNAMKQMSEEQQTILRLFYVENHNINEIGIILSIPKGTVKSRLFHAREGLKKRIKLKYHEK